MRQKFLRGEGATAAFLGFTIIALIISGILYSCQEENSAKVTAPNIPMFPEYNQPSEHSSEMGFYSSRGDGQFGAYAGDLAEFLISVPAGDYLLTYATTAGTYEIAFRAFKAAIVHVGMFHGVRVTDASVQKGQITNTTGNTWEGDSVTLFAWPGGPQWGGLFQSDGSASITVITGGQVAPGVKNLPLPQPASNPAPAPNPAPGSNPPTPNNSDCVVTNANDNGDGSLRQRLTNAACPTITFASSVTKITLAGTELTVARNVYIHGGGGVTISGNNLSRVFYVNSGVTASVAELTITGGKTTDNGGGIYNKGTLTLESSTTVSGNSDSGIFNGGTLIVNGTVSNNTANLFGGGIVNTEMLTLNGTVSGNLAMGGGGIFNDGTLLVNGTVSGNTANVEGGGIINYSRGTLTLNAGHRIEGNHADNDNNGEGNGGGIRTLSACPGNANYGGGNYRGSGTTTIDNCNGSGGVTPPTCVVAADTVLGYTNYERCLQGVAPLTQNSQLDAAAQGHSDAMVNQNFFDHTNPYTGSTADSRVTAAGYAWTAVAENIASGQSSPQSVVASWMASSGHRTNILNPAYVHMGIGVNGTTWTQVFAAPK